MCQRLSERRRRSGGLMSTDDLPEAKGCSGLPGHCAHDDAAREWPGVMSWSHRRGPGRSVAERARVNCNADRRVRPVPGGEPRRCSLQFAVSGPGRMGVPNPREVIMRVAPPVAELLEIAVGVVRPAADLARSMRVEGVDGVSTKTTDTDVVTAADRAVEGQVIAALRALRPDDGVVGEESGARAGDSGVRWILDPIDGTVNYLYGIPQYAVSLAAEVDGVVVAGVVRNAADGQEWTATLAGGAYREGRRLTGSRVTQLGQALLATGFGYQPARRRHQAAVLAQLLGDVRDIRRIGAAAIDLCMAAEGTVDVYYER